MQSSCSNSLDCLTEEAWFELMLVRSKIVQDDIDGGMAALFVAALNTFFNQAGHDMGLAGIVLKLFDGTTIRIFMKLSIVISDEAALHAIFA